MAKRTLIAAHATELPSGADGAKAPDWVHLLPYGTFQGRDGRGPYTLRDQAHAAQVIATTKQRLGTGDIPGDYDHQLLYSAQNGQPAPASGWIKELQARADGLWGRVEWTAEAAAKITAKAYRYLSPVFGHDQAGSVTSIRYFGLANNPNLELTALASQHLSEPDEETMDPKLLAAILALTGLSAGATEEQITAAAQKIADDIKTTKTSIAAIAKALGQAETATGEVIVAAAQDLAVKAKAGEPDPAKFVPISVLTELQESVAAMSQQLAGDKAGKAIADAKAQGKLAPAMEEWAKGYAAKDIDGFVAWCSQAPVIVAPSGGSTGGSGGNSLPPAKTGENGLTAEETAICKQIGITAQAFLETKKAKA